MSLSTHILDTTLGRPAADVAVTLALHDRSSDAWSILNECRTDLDGRVNSLLPGHFRPAGEPSILRLRFLTASYFAARHQSSLYPYIDLVFQIEGEAHYHIPLLLTANSYTTYRGS